VSRKLETARIAARGLRREKRDAASDADRAGEPETRQEHTVEVETKCGFGDNSDNHDRVILCGDRGV
jgi:hypothetical protein